MIPLKDIEALAVKYHTDFEGFQTNSPRKDKPIFGVNNASYNRCDFDIIKV